MPAPGSQCLLCLGSEEAGVSDEEMGKPGCHHGGVRVRWVLFSGKGAWFLYSLGSTELQPQWRSGPAVGSHRRHPSRLPAGALSLCQEGGACGEGRGPR